MLLNRRLHILCESAFSGLDTKWEQKVRKKVKKNFQKKFRIFFLDFFFGLCPCYYLAIPKKTKWKKWKPGWGGAPVLGHSSPMGIRPFVSSLLRRHHFQWGRSGAAGRLVFLFFLFPLFFFFPLLLFFSSFSFFSFLSSFSFFLLLFFFFPSFFFLPFLFPFPLFSFSSFLLSLSLLPLFLFSFLFPSPLGFMV